MPRKTRVLVSCDASVNATGLGRYCKHLCEGLHNSGEFVVAEQANFVGPAGVKDLPWEVFPVEPDPNNKMAMLKHMEDPENKYGKAVFNQNLLKFKPDFVVAISDPWMFAYQGRSPLREYFHWCVSPTVDSIPVRDDFISTYNLADSIFTYTDWALEALEATGLPNTNYTIRMGIDTSEFYPISNKAELKESFGLPRDAFIIGTVMRNQTRKLIADLIETFTSLMMGLPKPQQEKTFLYLHTTYPDQQAWDIPSFILNSRFSSNILFTYLCNSSRTFGCSRYQDAKTYSFSSNNLTCFMPSGKNALTNEQLCKVYNLMDLYVQIASCEGFGVPIIEAAACGVDCAVMNYSAMRDAANILPIYPLSNSTRFYNDNRNSCKRVYVDFNELAGEILSIIKDREPNQTNIVLAERAKEKYSWEKCIELWGRALSRERLGGLQGQWEAPQRRIAVPTEAPAGLSNSEFTEWCYKTYQPYNKHRHSLQALMAIRDLHYGITPSNTPSLFDREKMIKTFIKYAEEYNRYQEIRIEHSV